MFSLKINTEFDEDEFIANVQQMHQSLDEEHYGNFNEPELVQLTEDDIFTDDVRNEFFIAKGGFGSVSRAEYGERNTCVVKTIIVGDGKKEASKLKELDGIIPAFLGYKEEGKSVKIYMEKCDGSVDNLIKSGYFEGNDEKKMDFIQQVFVLTQSLKESNFAHCDFKAGNIGYIQTEEGMVYKLLDLGSACKLNDAGQGKAGLTTMDFKAPERIAIRSNVYDGHKLDIYAIGGMIFNLETGEMPMDNVRQLNQGQRADIIADRIEMKLVDYFEDHTCHDIPTNISEEMQNIIRDCWESDPEVRKSAEQMLAYHF
jgi:serine/threonine protein kinase